MNALQIVFIIVCVGVFIFQYVSEQRALRKLEKMVMDMKRNLEKVERR